VLAACGWQINTAFVERLNLTIRQHVAAVGRRVSTLCKGEDGVRHQLILYSVYYNFCLPHASLRQALPQSVPTKVTGSAKLWRQCTPAMAAGLTDHVWTLREVLLFRVPPWPQPVMVGANSGGGKQPEEGSEQVMCVHTACFKGITRARRTAGGPGGPSSLDLIYPSENRSGEPVVFIRSQQVRDRQSRCHDVLDVFFAKPVSYTED